MTTINLEANVKNLVTSAGLSLASSGGTVTLALNNSGLAQILSQILQSSSSVTVNYSASNNTISFTATASGNGGNQSQSPAPLIITNKNQFNSNREISVGLNQDVFLLATNDSDWDAAQTYGLLFPSNFSGVTQHLIYVSYSLTNGVTFGTQNLTALYDLSQYSNNVLMVVGTVVNGTPSASLYGSLALISP